MLIALLAVWLAAAPASTADPNPDLTALLKQGHYADAEAAARARLPGAEAAHGVDSEQAGLLLDIIVEAARHQGKVKDPEVLGIARRAIDIREKIHGPDHFQVARVLNNLANLLAQGGDQAAARPLYEKVLAIQERDLGPDSLSIGQTLNNLGNVVSDMGDYAGSLPMYERALAIKEKANGPEHERNISSLVNLSILLRLMGDYTGATRHAERALDIARKTLRADHPQAARALATLAAVHQEMGQLAEAERLMTSAIGILRREQDPDALDLAANLGDLANVRRLAGDLPEARRLYEQALEIQERILEADTPASVPILYSLGETLSMLGDLPAAKARISMGLDILDRSFGPGHPDAAEGLQLLAALDEKTGDTVQAMRRLEQALEIQEQSLGPAHPQVADTLAALAGLHVRQGDAAAALARAHRAEQIARDHLRLTIRALPQSQALRYAASRTSGIDPQLALAAGADPVTRRAIWDDLARSRALVLDEFAMRHRAIVTSDDPQTMRLARELEEARARLANLTLKGTTDIDPSVYRAALSRLQAEVDQAEKSLATRSESFRRDEAGGEAGLAGMLAALPAHSALVAYARFTPPAGGKEAAAPQYLAFVSGAPADSPAVVGLGDASRIERLIEAWSAAASTEPPALSAAAREAVRRYREAGEALRAAIWDPLAGWIGPARQVFVVPDAALHLVSLAALPSVRQGRYLVEEEPAIHYLSAERDLLATPHPEKDEQLLAMGGPDFDARPPGTLQPAGGGFRSPTPSCDRKEAMVFDPLDASRREAGEIVSLWRQRHGAAPHGEGRALTGPGASEEAFKQMAPRHGVLHIATHGFFLDQSCRPAAQALNPLVLSGLALAGANRPRGASGDAAEDGLLTAEEIASLDLSRVRWAVLSACETARGRIQEGEGVLGLRRAFQTAGAGAMIMSLWRVKDEPTRRWMRRLYAARLEARSTIESVRAAALAVLSDRRREGLSDHPFYWGAFVAAGDWR